VYLQNNCIFTNSKENSENPKNSNTFISDNKILYFKARSFGSPLILETLLKK
jgi:hypothetical protein